MALRPRFSAGLPFSLAPWGESRRLTTRLPGGGRPKRGAFSGPCREAVSRVQSRRVVAQCLCGCVTSIGDLRGYAQLGGLIIDSKSRPTELGWYIGPQMGS